MMEEEDNKTITRERLTGPRVSMSLGQLDVYRPGRLAVVRELAIHHRFWISILAAHILSISILHAVITLLVAGIVTPSSPQQTTFQPLHTYFMSPTGSDANNGLTPATAWASPNHSVVCGDVILAQAGSYSNQLVTWGTVSSCPSTSGGIDGIGGIYFATVLCAGTSTARASVGDCLFNGTVAGQSAGFGISASNWAIEGFASTAGYTANTSTLGYGFTVQTNINQLHHVAMVNNIAYHNGSGFTTDSKGANAGVGFGIDYWAIVGNIAQDSAGRCDGFYLGAIDVIGLKNFDTNAGTHIFVDGNFSYNNQQVGCTLAGRTDGESMMFDSIDVSGFNQVALARNNILVLSELQNMQFNTSNVASPTVKFYNNTSYASNKATNNTQGGTAFAGINAGGGASTHPWTLSVYNNIGQEVTATQPNGAPIYALDIGSGWTTSSAIVGGTGIENIFKGLQTACHGSFCDAGNNIVTFSAVGVLGTNIYTDPLFNNASDALSNRIGTPSCLGFTNTTACMGWNFGSQTATNPSLIYDMTPTAAQAVGKGYKPPGPCANSDADYPTWLKGVVYLQATNWSTGAVITENSGLINKLCGY